MTSPDRNSLSTSDPDLIYNNANNNTLIQQVLLILLKLLLY